MGQKKSPQERLNDPSSIIRLVAYMQVALLGSSFLGCWIKALNSSRSYGEVLASYLPFGWAPIALVLAIVGVLLYKRAERQRH